MAIGDDATAAGWPLVPDTGTDDAKVKYGAREINRTRDMAAQAKLGVPSSPAAFRTSAGISSGPTVPANTTGADGDIFFKV